MNTDTRGVANTDSTKPGSESSAPSAEITQVQENAHEEDNASTSIAGAKPAEKPPQKTSQATDTARSTTSPLSKQDLENVVKAFQFDREHRNQVAQAQVERAQKQKEPEPLQHEEARPDIHTDGIDMVGGRDVVQDAAPLKPEPHAVPRATSTAQKHEDAPVDHSNPDLSEVAADAEAMEFNKDRDFVDNAPRDFSVDEPVEVWSDHHNEWSAARVTSVHAAGQHAALVTCRLAGADRQLQTLFSKSPLLRKVAEGAGGVKSPTVAKTTAVEFCVGDKCEVWDDTDNKWVGASVQDVDHESGDVEVSFLSCSKDAMSKLLFASSPLLRRGNGDKDAEADAAAEAAHAKAVEATLEEAARKRRAKKKAARTGHLAPVANGDDKQQAATPANHTIGGSSDAIEVAITNSPTEPVHKTNIKIAVKNTPEHPPIQESEKEIVGAAVGHDAFCSAIADGNDSMSVRDQAGQPSELKKNVSLVDVGGTSVGSAPGNDAPKIAPTTGHGPVGHDAASSDDCPCEQFSERIGTNKGIHAVHENEVSPTQMLSTEKLAKSGERPPESSETAAIPAKTSSNEAVASKRTSSTGGLQHRTDTGKKSKEVPPSIKKTKQSSRSSLLGQSDASEVTGSPALATKTVAEVTLTHNNEHPRSFVSSMATEGPSSEPNHASSVSSTDPSSHQDPATNSDSLLLRRFNDFVESGIHSSVRSASRRSSRASHVQPNEKKMRRRLGGLSVETAKLANVQSLTPKQQDDLVLAILRARRTEIDKSDNGQERVGTGDSVYTKRHHSKAGAVRAQRNIDQATTEHHDGSGNAASRKMQQFLSETGISAKHARSFVGQKYGNLEWILQVCSCIHQGKPYDVDPSRVVRLAKRVGLTKSSTVQRLEKGIRRWLLKQAKQATPISSGSAVSEYSTPASGAKTARTSALDEEAFYDTCVLSSDPRTSAMLTASGQTLRFIVPCIAVRHGKDLYRLLVERFFPGLLTDTEAVGGGRVLPHRLLAVDVVEAPTTSPQMRENCDANVLPWRRLKSVGQLASLVNMESRSYIAPQSLSPKRAIYQPQEPSQRHRKQKKQPGVITPSPVFSRPTPVEHHPSSSEPVSGVGVEAPSPKARSPRPTAGEIAYYTGGSQAVRAAGASSLFSQQPNSGPSVSTHQVQGPTSIKPPRPGPRSLEQMLWAKRAVLTGAFQQVAHTPRVDPSHSWISDAFRTMPITPTSSSPATGNAAPLASKLPETAETRGCSVLLLLRIRIRGEYITMQNAMPRKTIAQPADVLPEKLPQKQQASILPEPNRRLPLPVTAPTPKRSERQKRAIEYTHRDSATPTREDLIEVALRQYKLRKRGSCAGYVGELFA
eukprot:INCI5014.7.p1 GENE.INCI5014.7~~INCI5014.7.p1  ORF type:complete len:1347 (-),score=204.70 INCI5014.7:3649-7689(-)